MNNIISDELETHPAAFTFGLSDGNCYCVMDLIEYRTSFVADYFRFLCDLFAKRVPGKYFLHGFMTSIVNSNWITTAGYLRILPFRCKAP